MFRITYKSSISLILTKVRFCHKVNKNSKEKPPPKVANDVVNFIESVDVYEAIKDDIPPALLRKYKTPESMYLINKKTAKVIADTVQKHLNKCSPIIEVNPGFGFLTEELLHIQHNHIYLYESSHNFSKYLKLLESRYPGCVTSKVADFFGMWKLSFQDKLDQGNRIHQLLGNLSTDDNDREVIIIGAMPSLSFIKHLIYNIVFHNSSNQLGKPNLFIAMTGHNYEFISDEAVQLSKHKSVPALFQLLFNFEVLKTIPKLHFLPWTLPSNNKRISMMDEYSLYLVNIIQKDKLPCPPAYLPLLWYFFKPQVFSKTTRVIPMLEQWIPGCGVWLITGQDPPDTNKELSPGPDDDPLPHMTIFTEFGDLSLKQKITVFKRFISWPEFEQCQFRVTMENNLPKFISQVDDDDKDSIVTHMDDMDSDTEHDT